MTPLRDQICKVLKMNTLSEDDKVQRRVRWVNAALLAVESGPGDLIEIGALAGDTTVLLCELAARYNRKMLVVDPWIAPAIDVAGWEHDVFMNKTKPWRESGTLNIIEKVSQNPKVISTLVRQDWAFALVDGSHKYKNVLCDIMSVRNARVICCDDMNNSDVRTAFDVALALLPEREGLYDPDLGRKWEGYLV